MSKQMIAYGVEPNRRPYSLRLARYQAIGETVYLYANNHFTTQKEIKILDVGGDEGRILRYIEKHSHTKDIQCDLVDLFPKGIERVYKGNERNLYTANFETDGLKEIEENLYDIIICEQVLEHLTKPEFLAAEMHRILKPGGIAIIGVPTFPPIFYSIRKTIVPRWDKIKKRKKQRSHIQVFSLRTFIKLLTSVGKWQIKEKRGFRIVSGGILKNLEFYRWWWIMNKILGKIFPFLCIEAQIVAIKSE